MNVENFSILTLLSMYCQRDILLTPELSRGKDKPGYIIQLLNQTLQKSEN